MRICVNIKSHTPVVGLEDVDYGHEVDLALVLVKIVGGGQSAPVHPKERRIALPATGRN